MIRSVFAIGILLAAAIPPSALAQQGEPQERLSISFPGKSWSLEIDSPGFVIQQEQRRPDGRVYLFATDPATKLLVSVTLEQAEGGADSSTCLDFLQKRAHSLPPGMTATDVQPSVINQMAVIEYFVPQAGGVHLRQKNLVACMAKEDIFIDIHLSKVQFHATDESLFTDLLNRVRIADRPAAGTPASTSPNAARTTTPAPSRQSGESSDELFAEGSRHFLGRDYQGAIAPYSAALKLEKKHPHLSKDYWRVLVDNLGMAYGITGDLDHADQTFEYGVSKDPGYPMFYYNLACTYAERNDMDKAMDYLKKAFSLKANSIPGEGMPDPRQDDSFQRFMSNERFRKLADLLVSSN